MAIGKGRKAPTKRGVYPRDTVQRNDMIRSGRGAIYQVLSVRGDKVIASSSFGSEKIFDKNDTMKQGGFIIIDRLGD